MNHLMSDANLYDVWQEIIGYTDEEMAYRYGPRPTPAPNPTPDASRDAQHDPVNSPAYYGAGSVYETIKVIEAWDLNFRLANVVKYVSRVGKKGDALQDLKKARWYLDREIQNREQAK